MLKGMVASNLGYVSLALFDVAQYQGPRAKARKSLA